MMGYTHPTGLSIYSPQKTLINTDYGNKEMRKYLQLQRYIEIPNKFKNIDLGTIELPKAAYIWGQFQDTNGTPVPNLPICYQPTDNDIRFRNCDYTDSNGNFFIDYISSEKGYMIKAFNKDN